jgi:hypothetical protein
VSPAITVMSTPRGTVLLCGGTEAALIASRSGRFVVSGCFTGIFPDGPMALAAARTWITAYGPGATP